ncbi:MAG: glycosyltransferase family 4 protein [Kiritimatiellia bacterium]
MKVTFLVPDLGWPIVGIAARFAKYVCREHEVEIVGPRLWGGTNAMYSDEFEYRAVDCPKIYRFPEYFREVRKLARAIQGDVVISMKAFGGNLPAALLAKRERGCRVVAYLDEWDGATSASWSFGERLRHWRRDWMHPGNAVYVPRVERRLPECDVRLGTTRFLERKFGCRIFHVGVDRDRFKPQDSAAVAALKRELGLEGKKLGVFGGVARPHKGVEVFAEALARLGREDVALVILGPMDEGMRSMLRHPVYGKFVRCPATDAEATRRIHREMPLYLGLGDALIVPLADTAMARSQMPCKVFEAMAMAKPIVASAVSDLPEVLDGCGHLVAPGDPEAVAQALATVFADPDAAQAMGARARARCLERYGAETSRKALLELLDELK